LRPLRFQSFASFCEWRGLAQISNGFPSNCSMNRAI
jgi:hypothetical protein